LLPSHGLAPGSPVRTRRAGVYWALGDLLNLEIDLFFDNTSTYFETDKPDPPSADGLPHLRSLQGPPPRPAPGRDRAGGDPRQHPDPVWTWPGNASDQELIRQVKENLRAWKLTPVVWVTDIGFNSAQNRRYLRQAGGHYITGEKLRAASKEAESALARQGRYHKVAGNLEVKEVVLDDGNMRDRFVICRNPEAAERDRSIRAQLLEQLEAAIANTDDKLLAERLTLLRWLRANTATVVAKGLPFRRDGYPLDGWR